MMVVMPFPSVVGRQASPPLLLQKICELGLEAQVEKLQELVLSSLGVWLGCVVVVAVVLVVVEEGHESYVHMHLSPH